MDKSKELEKLRSTGFERLIDIFQSIESRKSTIRSIQNIKSSSQVASFLPSREVEVFRAIVDKLNLSNVDDLLMLSLIIESQASNGTSYPKWSEGVHLNRPIESKWDQINPVLLATITKSRYDALPIKQDFKDLIDKSLES